MISPACNTATTEVLSRREQAAVEFIREYVAAHGWAPSLREIGDGIGLGSTSSVKWVLEQLARKGAIRRAEGKPRAIVVVDGVE
ncbi:MAG TPA: hypothetical protein VFJ21_05895 [Mycobacteriales bacterium]|nr:hypothetical protein [Mycobacteriales bacterium]